MDFNLNLAYCIKEAHSWGHDSFYNICKGTKEIVPWGSMDWTWSVVGWSALASACTIGLACASIMVFALYWEIKDA